MGKHSTSRTRLIRRRRRIVAAGLAVAVAAGAAVAWLARGHDPLVRPDDPCLAAPPLRTSDGVTLQPAALRAFKHAQRLANGRIEVVQSYRSCGQQAEACRNICGDENGCPGRCASPGTSYHQLGAAVDITQGSLDAPGVIAALVRAGWCQSEPHSDPGHFSFAGCH
jgi:D-alanyl-D-alanine carboxypeptidase